MPKKEWQVARVRDEADRKTSGNSDFISLDEGEKFLGYYLGQADPKIDDPAHFEYKTHWINGGSVPCAGEVCPNCEDGDRPRTKAMTLWLVTEDEKGTKLGKKGVGETRIFDMPVSVIKQFTELRSEDEKVKGRLFRVSRPEEKSYMLLPKTANLKAAEIKELLKDGPDFEAMLTSKLRKAMEGVALKRVLEDEDDDDDGDKKGKKADKSKKSQKETSDEWPDDGLEEETVTVVKVEKKGQWIEVEHDDYDGTKKVWTTDDIEFDLTDLSKGDEVTVSTSELDSDDEYVLSEEPETVGDGDDDGDSNADVEDIEDETFELVSVKKSKNTVVVEHEGEEIELVGGKKIDLEGWKKGHEAVISAEYDSDDETWELTAIAEPEEEGSDEDAGAAAAKDDLPDEIEEMEFTVTEIDEKNQTIDIENDEISTTLFFLDKGPASKVDFDDYKEGDKITVTAEKDSMGDMVATAIPEVAKEKGGKKAGGKKGGKAAAGKKGGKGKK